MMEERATLGLSENGDVISSVSFGIPVKYAAR